MPETVRRFGLPRAAAYLGFKTTGGLRKAHLEQRIFPAGRRGGRGTYIWSVEPLDRFLRGEPPAILSEERSGAPPHGGAKRARVNDVTTGRQRDVWKVLPEADAPTALKWIEDECKRARAGIGSVAP